MLQRIVLSVVIAVAVALGLTFLAELIFPIVKDANNSASSILLAAATFLKMSAGLIGVLAGVWFYFTRKAV